MKPTTVFAVLAVFLLALVGTVAAQTVDVNVSGTVTQSITITSTGSATGWVLNPGVTNVNSGVTVHRTQNVPTKLMVVETVKASKPVTSLGYMHKYSTSTNTYYLDAAAHLAAKLQVKAGAGTLIDVPSTSTQLLAAGGIGTLDDVITFSQAVAMNDPTWSTPVTDVYRATVTIDAMP